jgi:hypothetical protein
MSDEYRIEVLVRIVRTQASNENLSFRQEFPFRARDFTDIARVLGEFQSLADTMSGGDAGTHQGPGVVKDTPSLN